MSAPLSVYEKCSSYVMLFFEKFFENFQKFFEKKNKKWSHFLENDITKNAYLA